MKSLSRVLLLLAFFAACAAAAQTGLSPESLQQRYPAGTIQSTQAADSALAEVSQARAQVEASSKEGERLCYPQFFTTACLAQVSERRREALVMLRSIEVEANTFIRRARVEARDKELADKRAQDEAENRQREQEQAQKLAGKQRGTSEADAAAEQKKRAEKAQAYERKQQDVARRLREAQENQAAKTAK